MRMISIVLHSLCPAVSCPRGVRVDGDWTEHYSWGPRAPQHGNVHALQPVFTSNFKFSFPAAPLSLRRPYLPVILEKTDTTLWNWRTSVEKLPPGLWKSSLSSSICFHGFSAVSYLTGSIWVTSQWLTFLSRCSLYSCDIFLPTFCQYLGLKGCILNRRIQLCFLSPSQMCNDPLSRLVRVQSGLNSAVGVCACVCRHNVLLFHCFFFLIVSPHSYSQDGFCSVFPRYWSNTKVLKGLVSKHFTCLKKKTPTHRSAYFDNWRFLFFLFWKPNSRDWHDYFFFLII